jgi:hypothetical protein
MESYTLLDFKDATGRARLSGLLEDHFCRLEIVQPVGEDSQVVAREKKLIQMLHALQLSILAASINQHSSMFRLRDVMCFFRVPWNTPQSPVLAALLSAACAEFERHLCVLETNSCMVQSGLASLRLQGVMDAPDRERVFKIISWLATLLCPAPEGESPP